VIRTRRKRTNDAKTTVFAGQERGEGVVTAAGERKKATFALRKKKKKQKLAGKNATEEKWERAVARQETALI